MKRKFEFKQNLTTGNYSGIEYTMSFSGKGDTLEAQEIWKEGVNITEEIDEKLYRDIEDYFINEYYEPLTDIND